MNDQGFEDVLAGFFGLLCRSACTRGLSKLGSFSIAAQKLEGEGTMASRYVDCKTCGESFPINSPAGL